MQTFRAFFLRIVLHSVALIAAQGSGAGKSSWQTLSGNAPLVIAKGGFSGIFADSSLASYSLALMTSLPNVILWCDVQLTKDAAGICLPDLKLDNSTNIADVYKNKKKVYLVNGVPVSGWFSVDYTLDDLSNIYLSQGIYSRTDKFNGNPFNVLTVENVAALQFKPPALWLNIEHDEFFRQHNLSMRRFVLSVSRKVIVDYVSSPEVVFLSSIAARFRGSGTKLVFRFLGADVTEPSTNWTYGSILRNLTFVKTFASGILVPKNYIWPVNAGLYLEEPRTSVVLDAHREGLEVFASDFANDAIFSYNYSYDPVAEYLSFIDNGKFSVDGVLSDFPITPSSAIDCFSHISKNASGQALPPIVISHNGASGLYPGSTDRAYQQAVKDGADYIDCSVRMTKDGIPICLGSINLIDSTTVAQSKFNSRSATIPEIQETPGIFTFNLTWEEIQSLRPAISNPFMDYRMFRNPASKNEGNFTSLDDFLKYAKSNPLAGVMISIEYAAYLAKEEDLDISNAVLTALSNSGYNNHTTQKVMIRSSESSVLTVFKEQTKYRLVYLIDEDIRDALNSSIEDIKQFADSVAISKSSIYPDNQAFLIGVTDIVPKLHSFGLLVYVYTFKNEFVSQAWDFFSDPIVEINSFVMGTGIDGVITDFPGTAVAYRKNRCLGKGSSTPIYMSPVEPGSLIQVITEQYMPPAESPNPVLTDNDVLEPPLPPVSEQPPPSNTHGIAAAPTSPPTGQPASGQPHIADCIFLSSLSMLFACLLLF